MKLALLQGNRFTPWHLAAFRHLRENPDITAFRAESEIQRHFESQGADALDFPIEPIHFDTHAGFWIERVKNRFLARYGNREAQILPFHERLRGFDLLQSWELFTDWSGEAAEARRKWDIPLAVMVWDNIPFNMEHSAYRRDIKAHVRKQADRFLVHTERSRRMLRLEGVEDARIVKIAPGVDTHLFSPGTPDRARFGFDAEDLVLLFVGWLLPRKGIDFLLMALRELVDDPKLAGRRLRLWMVGAGPGRDRVEALVRRLGLEQVCVFGGSAPYTEMPAYFRVADVFVLPSIATPQWQEQFGMSLIEAMASGVPVVSTLSGAIPEIVGDAGLLCQPNDFVALHGALRRLLTDPSARQELAQRGRTHAESCFSLEGYAENLSAIYEEMLRG